MNTAPHMNLDTLNVASPSDFIAALAGIYEHSPWVAETIVTQRPFADVDALAHAMADAVAQAGDEAQMRLIRAHPQLAGKAAIAGELTESSTREQRGAGLDQCTPEEFARLTQLNDAYQEKFGFPFILAVKGHTRDSILANLAARLPNGVAEERVEALWQIDRIARFRLETLLAATSA